MSMFDPQNARLDAAESVFFKEQLAEIDSTVYSEIFPDLRGRELIPTQPGVPDWARVYKWRMFDRFGRAKIIANMAGDLPRVDARGTEGSKIIKNIGDSYGWDIFEIKEAAAQQTPLDSMKALAARYAADEEIDRILALGDTDHNLEGLLTFTGAATFTPSTKAAGGTEWANATPDEIAKDLFRMARERVEALKAADAPTFSRFTIVLPIGQYGLIAETRMGDGSDQTILRHVLANSPWIEAIEHWYRLDGAGTAGADMIACYPRNPLVIAGLVPMEFTTLPPQERNLEFVINAVASCGGIVVRYPVAVGRGEGI